MNSKNRIQQYSLIQILLIWAAAAVPMGVLGWIAFPALSKGLATAEAGLLRLRLLTIGLIWQFALSMIILYREEGNIRLKTIRCRYWLNHPQSPKTGQENKKLWWWIIPLILLTVSVEFLIFGPLNELWVSAFPFLAEPPGYAAASLFEIPEQWVGAWNLLAIFTVLAVFNTFLGEEFVFRGLMLPKMAGFFGKWDWVANGVLFGVYHLHQPWGLPSSILLGLIFAFTGKRFRTNWFPIILHSGQSVFIFVLILGLVLGLA